MSEEAKAASGEKKEGYGALCCKCKDRTEVIIKVNLFMSVAMIVYAFFSLINVFNWFSSMIFINILFPLYYM